MSQTITDTTTLLNPTHRYTKSGIGGAGNIRKTTSIPSSSSAPRIIPAPSKGMFSTGIGGAGNSRSYEERASISFEEALARDSFRKLSVAGSYHRGIGGVGNRSSVSESSASSSVESNGGYFSSEMTVQSGADRAKDRMVSFFGGAGRKRSSVVDEKDCDVSTDGRSSLTTDI